jgi:histidinol-phosphate aminotransferase
LCSQWFVVLTDSRIQRSDRAYSDGLLYTIARTLLLGGRVVDVPRLSSHPFSIDVQEIEKAVLQHEAKVLFLTSPNNPDGGIISDADIDRLLQLPVLVVLDEAYIEFSSSAVSRISDVPSQDNLVVLRTFSKRAALAGAILAIHKQHTIAFHLCTPQASSSLFFHVFFSGLRIGYGAFPTSLIQYIWRAKQPYNVSVAAEVAACAALGNNEYLTVSVPS